jgi:hypothetical protein
MAVEIKELVIRAVAVEEDKKKDPPQPPSPMMVEEEALIQKAVKASVKEVLRILKRKNSR